MSLNYFMKSLSSKIDMLLKDCVKQIAQQDLAIWNSWWKIFIPWCYHYFSFYQKDIYTGCKPTESQTVCTCSNQEKGLCVKMPMHTVTDGIDSTPAWYLLMMESRLMRPVSVTWSCYNSSCPPHVRFQASSFSRTVLWHTGRSSRATFLPLTLPYVNRL